MMTIEEAIWKEEALAYSFGERYKRLGEPVGDLPELEAEHKQYAEWLRELKAYKKAYTEIASKIESNYMRNNEYEMAVSDGYQSAINIIDRCIEEVNADGDSD